MDLFFILILVVLVGAAIWAFKSQSSSGDADSGEHMETISEETLNNLPPAASE